MVAVTNQRATAPDKVENMVAFDSHPGLLIASFVQDGLRNVGRFDKLAELAQAMAKHPGVSQLPSVVLNFEQCGTKIQGDEVASIFLTYNAAKAPHQTVSLCGLSDRVQADLQRMKMIPRVVPADQVHPTLNSFLHTIDPFSQRESAALGALVDTRRLYSDLNLSRINIREVNDDFPSSGALPVAGGAIYRVPSGRDQITIQVDARSVRDGELISARFMAALDDIIVDAENGLKLLLVDLKGVTHLGGSARSKLIETSRRMKEMGGGLSLRNVDLEVVKSLRIQGLQRFFEIAEEN